jgi:uncharacterized phage-associated protein
LGTGDKIALVKLMFLADKYHLVKYGRLITDDDYIAMKMGPVGSLTKDILDFNERRLNESQMGYVKSKIIKTGEHNYGVIQNAEETYKHLSESDKQALDYIVEKLRGVNKWSIKNYTHKYPEWKKFEKELGSGKMKSAPIRREELFSILEDELFDVSKEHVEDSKESFSGICS